MRWPVRDSVEGRGGERRLVGGVEDQPREGLPPFGSLAAVGDRNCRAVGLGHEVPGVGGGDLGVPLEADAQLAGQPVAGGPVQAGQRRPSSVELLSRREGVAVAHLHIDPERCRQVGEAVDLAIAGLADPAGDGDEVVAVDGARPTGDGARRALGPVALVAVDAVLRSDLGADHLERVELGGDLEERTGVGRVAVERTDVRHDLAHRQRPRRPGALRVGPLREPRSELGQRGSLESPTAHPAPVHPRRQQLPVHLEPSGHGVVAVLSKAGQRLEPHVPAGYAPAGAPGAGRSNDEEDLDGLGVGGVVVREAGGPAQAATTARPKRPTPRASPA